MSVFVLTLQDVIGLGVLAVFILVIGTLYAIILADRLWRRVKEWWHSK